MGTGPELRQVWRVPGRNNVAHNASYVILWVVPGHCMTKRTELGVCRGTGTGSTVLLVTDGTTLLGWSLCVVGLVTDSGWRLKLVVAISGYVLQMRGDGAITTPVSLPHSLRATERSEGGSRRSRNYRIKSQVCMPPPQFTNQSWFEGCRG
jgi:hypothetical protein